MAARMTSGRGRDEFTGGTMSGTDPDELARQLAAGSSAAGDPLGWFEPLYAAAGRGEAVVPWDRGAAHPLLVTWAQAHQLSGGAGRALVVGCGPGYDAEYVAGLGFDTVAFDIAASAVRAAQERFPGSQVQYRTADLLDPPADWREAFDLVVESYTVQALPDPPRRDAITSVGRMVGPGGTLIVIALARGEHEDPGQGPPWPLTRAEIEAFAVPGVQPVRIEEVRDPTVAPRWRAESAAPARASDDVAGGGSDDLAGGGSRARAVPGPREPARVLLEDGPDASGVVDDVQRRDAFVGGEFQHIDHIERGLPPARQLPVEMEPDGDQRRAVRRGALRHPAERQPRLRGIAEQRREEITGRGRAIERRVHQCAVAEQGKHGSGICPAERAQVRLGELLGSHLVSCRR
jgi:SAM-dependent methyltransferase